MPATCYLIYTNLSHAIGNHVIPNNQAWSAESLGTHGAFLYCENKDTHSIIMQLPSQYRMFSSEREFVVDASHHAFHLNTKLCGAAALSAEGRLPLPRIDYVISLEEAIRRWPDSEITREERRLSSVELYLPDDHPNKWYAPEDFISGSGSMTVSVQTECVNGIKSVASIDMTFKSESEHFFGEFSMSREFAESLHVWLGLALRKS